MTLFQKLFWMQQMGIRYLCDEVPHPLGSAVSNLRPGDRPLLQLEQKIRAAKNALVATATHPLIGAGVVPAKVMCILEMPTAAEDRTGEPLTGPEGDLLKKMLGAIELDIHRDTRIAYLSPWRSPGARVLTNTETQEGLKLLKEQIKMTSPKVLLLFGLSVTQAVLGLPLGQARSKKHELDGQVVFSTFAPGFLIKNAEYKKGAWEDLKKVHAFLKE